MKGNKKVLLSSVVALGAIAMVGVPGVLAAETIGTVTGNDGDVKDLLSISAEVVEVDGSHVTFEDVDTAEQYSTSFGPSWYTDSYEVGDSVEVVGVETEAENNDNEHNFQALEVDGVELREEFEGKPAWAGTRGGGNGDGTGTGTGSMNKGAGNSGAGFIDADGDGVCDSAI